jgi:hypothetical protein
MTEVFTAETTIDGPVDAVWGPTSRLGHCRAMDVGRGRVARAGPNRRWHNLGLHHSG